MALEVAYPLSTITDTDDSVLSSIFKFVLDLTKDKEFVQFIQQAVEDETASNQPVKKRVISKAKSATRPPHLMTIRQVLTEMRGLDEITCDTKLSNGDRVGEFLLKQWLAKEGKKN
jgi:hypothetical protein